MGSSKAHLIVKKQGPGGADYDERTAGEQSKDDPGDAGYDQRLWDTDGVVRFRAHQTAESDGAGQRRKVDENDRRQALRMQTVLEI
jgi:hypothetical protein